MGDRGIEQIIPHYEKSLMSEADITYWEVLYHDGTTLCEARGGKYPEINRSELASFRLVHAGEIIVEFFPPPGFTGHNLVYRRRSSLGGPTGRGVVFIVGWSAAGVGPMFRVNLDVEKVFRDDNLMQTLTPMPGEPDDLLPLAG